MKLLSVMIASFLIGCMAGTLGEKRKVETVQAAVPTAASSVDIPCSGSVKDDAGNVWSITQTAHVTKTEAPPVPPVPVGIVFGPVTETLGKVVIAKPSGWGLILHGSGFPVAGLLRLQVAGRIAPAATLVWRPETIEFTVPPGPPSATGAVTGPFEIYRQENNVWKLLGKGGSFTILPDPIPPVQ